MDPNATALIMRDATLPLDERQEAAENLLGWVQSGGFPQSIPGRSFGGNTAAKFAARQECEAILAL